MHKLTNVLTLAVVILSAACARSYPPPGGERDVQPPRLIGTSPGPLEVVPGFNGPAVFRFDERLSERGFAESLVVVSPLDSTMRVERGRTEVRVRLDGGWRPDRVYRITLLPGVRDLFGNARTAQAEIVFSTGPPIPETAIAGVVQDRITGRAAANTVVRAVRRADEVVYTAIGDETGFFSLRHLPLGSYDVLAFSDQNRNRRRDPVEPVDSTVVTLGAPADTVPVVFSVLPPDSTPPRPTRVEVLDSMRLRVTFDDYFATEEPLLGGNAEVHALPDSVPFAVATRVLQAPLYEAVRGEAAATAARQAVDTAQVRDTVVAPPPPPPPAAAPAGAPRVPLPARELVVVLERPLAPGQTYTVTVSGVTNISGLTGGGVARFEVPAARQPPPQMPQIPPPARPDTSGIR
jgi:hypothetical protein